MIDGSADNKTFHLKNHEREVLRRQYILVVTKYFLTNSDGNFIMHYELGMANS